MKLKLILITMLFAAVSCQQPYENTGHVKSKTAEQTMHIYLLIGQSNMAGRAPYTEQESAVIDSCFLLNGEDKWEPAKNPLNMYSTIRKNISMQKYSLGYSFAQTMLDRQPGTTIGLVVNAKGGTKIEQWAKGTQFYNEALRRARIAQKNGTIKGILWHQGESNSSSPDSYLAKLQSLIEDLRNDLNLPKLPFVAGQVYYNPDTKPKNKAINDQLAMLPDAVPFTGCASSAGLTTFDNVHFNLESAKLLGIRYANSMLKLQR